MKTIQYDSSKMTINGGILSNYFAPERDVIIPEGVVGIGEEAFYAVRDFIERVTLPEGLIWIGSSAFKDCSRIGKINLPVTLVDISDYAFSGCSGLSEIRIPENVYRIGTEAFSNCDNLRVVYCVEGLIQIESRAFSDCPLLMRAELPSSCMFIDETSFACCDNLTIFSAEGTEAEWFAKIAGIRFRKKRISSSFEEWQEKHRESEEEFVIRNGVLTQYNGADDTIKIPEEVRIISAKAFMQNMQLKSISIPETVTVIGSEAFSGCSGLHEIEFSGDFLYVCKFAFQDCITLESAIFNSDGTVLRPYAFSSCKDLSKIIFPPENVTVCAHTFNNCKIITDVLLPVSGMKISPNAFPEDGQSITWYLSCRSSDYETLSIRQNSEVCLYDSTPDSFSALRRYFSDRKIKTFSEEDAPDDIAEYFTYFQEEEQESKEMLETKVTEKKKEKIAEQKEKEVNYKETIEIKGTAELSKCDIALNGENISDEQIIRYFMKYTDETIRAKEHNVGIVIHPGSICFNAVLLMISALEALLLNTSTSAEIISSLEPGDYVLYYPKPSSSPQKYILEKTDIDGKIYLKKNNRTKEQLILPASSAHKISPYYGESETTSNVGLKKHSPKRTDFYNTVLKTDSKEIPAAPNVSVIILLPKTEAMFYWKNLELRYGNKTYHLSDFLTAAYYSENGTTYFAGNPGKTDPVLKFTDNVFKARELAADSYGNSAGGILILSPDYIDRSYSEVAEIISNKKLRFVYCSLPLSRFETSQILNEYNDSSVFVCSPEYINRYLDKRSLKAVNSSRYVSELRSQLLTIKNRIHLEETVDIGVSVEDYYSLREEILSFKYSENNSDEKNLFVMESLAALKILMSALFPVDLIARELGKPDFETRLDQIRRNAADLPTTERKKADSILDTLLLLYYELGEKPGKEPKFKEIVNRYRDGKIALIVPKAYYAQIIYNYDYCYKQLIDNGRLFITTATRFDTTQHYAAVVFISNTYGRGFSPQRCYAAENVIALLYTCEIPLYNYTLKRIRTLQDSLNTKNYFTDIVVEDASEPEYRETDTEQTEPIVSDEELDNYIEQVSNDYLLRPLSHHIFGQTNAYSEIAAIVSFETGERAFLTKYYSPYVLDENEGEIRSPKVEDLNIGDLLVFNTDYYGTRDVVDTILQNQLQGRDPSDGLIIAYKDSQHWKQVLRDYMTSHNKTARQVGVLLKAQGISVEVPTIIGWIDPESHTVGPRDPAVFQQIGFLVDDSDLFSNPDRYVKACSAIRSKRGEILRDISKTMLDILSGTHDTDSVPAAESQLIGKLAQTYRIENIQKIKRTVPNGITNRPIEDTEI